MLKEDQEFVQQIIKEEIAKISIPKTIKPVEVDIDSIIEKVVEKVVTIVLDKIKTDTPKKGKEKINVEKL